MHKTSRSPCTLMHHLYNTDILLTPHGFQSMLLLFLPRPGLMFEIFPEKYYKRGYGPFGAEYGTYKLVCNDVYHDLLCCRLYCSQRIKHTDRVFLVVFDTITNANKSRLLSLSSVPIFSLNLLTTGVTHGGTMSPSTGYYQQLVLPYVSSAYCMESKFCRGFARNQDVMYV